MKNTAHGLIRKIRSIFVACLKHDKKAVCFFLAAAMLFPAPASSGSVVRDQEISDCRLNEVISWGDGIDRPATGKSLTFYYSHSGSPPWFTEEQTRNMVLLAAEAWSKCGIPAGIASSPQQAVGKNVIKVQWDEKESRGNFGLANVTLRTLSLSPRAFELLRRRNPKYDAGQTLQMTISHEMGHFFGLMAHSRRCVDVMSYYTNGKGESCYSRAPMSAGGVVEYRHLFPTACDIERCRKVNGKSPLPGGRLP